MTADVNGKDGAYRSLRDLFENIHYDRDREMLKPGRREYPVLPISEEFLGDTATGAAT